MKVGDLVRGKTLSERGSNAFYMTANGKIGIILNIYSANEINTSEDWARVYIANGNIRTASYPLSVLEVVV